MRKTTHAPGTIHRLMIDSKALAGNRLGDPTERIIDVYVPHGHDGKGLPLLVDLVGFTAGGPAHTNWKSFTENVPERLDRLIGDLIALSKRARKQSLSMLVPMGQEMAYRYQERLIADLLDALRAFRDRLGA